MKKTLMFFCILLTVFLTACNTGEKKTYTEQTITAISFFSDKSFSITLSANIEGISEIAKTKAFWSDKNLNEIVQMIDDKYIYKQEENYVIILYEDEYFVLKFNKTENNSNLYALLGDYATLAYYDEDTNKNAYINVPFPCVISSVISSSYTIDSTMWTFLKEYYSNLKIGNITLNDNSIVISEYAENAPLDVIITLEDNITISYNIV